MKTDLGQLASAVQDLQNEVTANKGVQDELYEEVQRLKAEFEAFRGQSNTTSQTPSPSDTDKVFRLTEDAYESIIKHIRMETGYQGYISLGVDIHSHSVGDREIAYTAYAACTKSWQADNPFAAAAKLTEEITRLTT